MRGARRRNDDVHRGDVRVELQHRLHVVRRKMRRPQERSRQLQRVRQGLPADHDDLHVLLVGHVLHAEVHLPELWARLLLGDVDQVLLESGRRRLLLLKLLLGVRTRVREASITVCSWWASYHDSACFCGGGVLAPPDRVNSARSHEQSTDADTRGSHTRVKSARMHAVTHDDDAHERPTLVPAEESPLAESMEARILFETRAAEERRRAVHEEDRPTRRVDAIKTLTGMEADRARVAPPHHRQEKTVFIEEDDEPEIEVRWEDPQLEARRTLVQLFAFTLFLAIVASVVAPLAIAHKKAIQEAIVMLLRAR
jgi:hypothetical protein